VQIRLITVTNSGALEVRNTAVQHRTKRRGNKLHAYRLVINHFDYIGEPKEPDTVIAPYHNTQGAIVRKLVLIKFRYWKKRKGQEDWCVTDEIKKKCWDQMVKLFEFSLHRTDTKNCEETGIALHGKKMEAFQV